MGIVITGPNIDVQGIIAWWRSLWFDAHNDVQPLRDAAAACRAYAAKIDPVAPDSTAILNTGLTDWESPTKTSYMEDWSLNYSGIQYDTLTVRASRLIAVNDPSAQALLPSLQSQILATASALDNLATTLENYLTGLRAQKWQEVLMVLVAVAALATVELGGEGGLLLGICAQMGVDIAGALAILGAELAGTMLGTVFDLVAPAVLNFVMPALDAATVMALGDLASQEVVNAVVGEHISMITGQPQSGIDWSEVGLSAISGAVMGLAGRAAATALDPVMSSASPLLRQVISRGLGVGLGGLGDVPFQIAHVASDGWNWSKWSWPELVTSGAMGGVMGGRISDLFAQRPDIIIETADGRTFYVAVPKDGGFDPGGVTVTDPSGGGVLGTGTVKVDILNPQTGDVVGQGYVSTTTAEGGAGVPVTSLRAEYEPFLGAFGPKGTETAGLEGATLHTFSAEGGIDRYVAYQVSGDHAQPVFQTETAGGSWTRIATFDPLGNPKLVEVQGKLPADAYVNVSTREVLGHLPEGVTAGDVTSYSSGSWIKLSKGSWLALDEQSLVTAATRPMAGVLPDKPSLVDAHTTELYVQGPDGQLHRLGFVRSGSPSGIKGYEFYPSVDGIPIEIRADGAARIVVVDGIQRFGFGPSGRVELTFPARAPADTRADGGTETAGGSVAADGSLPEQVQQLSPPHAEADGSAVNDVTTSALPSERPVESQPPAPVAGKPGGKTGMPGEPVTGPATEDPVKTTAATAQIAAAEPVKSDPATVESPAAEPVKGEPVNGEPVVVAEAPRTGETPASPVLTTAEPVKVAPVTALSRPAAPGEGVAVRQQAPAVPAKPSTAAVTAVPAGGDVHLTFASAREAARALASELNLGGTGGALRVADVAGKIEALVNDLENRLSGGSAVDGAAVHARDLVAELRAIAELAKAEHPDDELRTLLRRALGQFSRDDGRPEALTKAPSPVNQYQPPSPARSFASNAKADQYGQDTWDTAQKKLTRAQKNAVQDYALATYKDINGFLRGSAPASLRTGKTIELIDQALRVKPVPERILAYRSVDPDAFDRPVTSLAGTTQVSPSYLSTELAANPKFASYKEVLMHLDVPAGTPGLYLGDVLGGKDGERELLLGRGLSYTADRVEVVDYPWGRRYHVYARILGPAEATGALSASARQLTRELGLDGPGGTVRVADVTGKITALAGDLESRLNAGSFEGNAAAHAADLAEELRKIAELADANHPDDELRTILRNALSQFSRADVRPAELSDGPSPTNQWFIQKIRQAIGDSHSHRPAGEPAVPAANATVADLEGAYRMDFQPDNAYSLEKSRKIARLSDEELLNAVFRPKDGAYITVERMNTPWGWRQSVVEGNHRASELLVRIGRPGSSITPDTPIYIHYTGHNPTAAQQSGPPEINGTAAGSFRGGALPPGVITRARKLLAFAAAGDGETLTGALTAFASDLDSLTRGTDAASIANPHKLWIRDLAEDFRFLAEPLSPEDKAVVMRVIANNLDKAAAPSAAAGGGEPGHGVTIVNMFGSPSGRGQRQVHAPQQAQQAPAGQQPAGAGLARVQRLAVLLREAQQSAQAPLPSFAPPPTSLYGTVIDPQAARTLDEAAHAMTEAREQLENLNRILQTITPEAWAQRPVHGDSPLRDPFLSPLEMSELSTGLRRAARLAARFRAGYASVREAYERSVAAARREAGWHVPDAQAQALLDVLVREIAARQRSIAFALKTAGLDGSLTRVSGEIRRLAAELDPARIAARHGLPAPGTTARAPQRLTSLLTSLSEVRSALQALADPARAVAMTDPVGSFHRAAGDLSLALKIATDNAPAQELAATLERQLRDLSGVTRRLIDTSWSLRTPADVAQMAELNLEIKQAEEALQALRGQHAGLNQAHDIALARRQWLDKVGKASQAIENLSGAINGGRVPSLAELRNLVKTQLQTLDNLKQEASDAEKWWDGLTSAGQAAIAGPVRGAMVAAGLPSHLAGAVADAAKYHAYAKANPHLRPDIYWQYNARLREIRAALKTIGPDALPERQRLLAEQREIGARKRALENQALVTAQNLHREAVQTRVDGMLTQFRNAIAARSQAIADAEKRLSSARSQAGIGTTREEQRLTDEITGRLTGILDVTRRLGDLATLATSPAGDGHVTDAALRFVESAVRKLDNETTRLARAAQEWQQARASGLAGDVAAVQRRIAKVLDDVGSRREDILFEASRHDMRLMSAPERNAAGTAQAIGDIVGDARIWDLTSAKADLTQAITRGLPAQQQTLVRQLLSSVAEAQRELGELHRAASDLTARAAEGDHLTPLRKLSTAASAAGTLHDDITRVPGLVHDLADSFDPRNPAPAARPSRALQAVAGEVTRLTGKIRRFRGELDEHLRTTGLPARIEALQAAVAARRSETGTVAAQIEGLRGKLAALRAAAPRLTPFLPTDSDLTGMGDLAGQVTWLANRLDQVAGDFAVGGAKRRQGLHGVNPGGILLGADDAARNTQHAADIIQGYAQSLEQIRAAAQSALDHANAGRLDAARMASQDAYRRITGLRSQVNGPSHVKAFMQAMMTGDRLMLPGPRGLADLAAAAGHGATTASQAAPVIQDALDQMRATPVWRKVSGFEAAIRAAEKERNAVLHTDPATEFFDPLILAAGRETTIAAIRYRPVGGWRFEHLAFTPREGELGRPLLERLVKHPGDLLRTALSLNRRSFQTFGAVEYVIRDGQGNLYRERVTDQHLEMDRGPWGRDLNEQQFGHAPSFSVHLGPVELALTPIEHRAAFLMPGPGERFEWTRQTRTMTREGTPVAWTFPVSDTPRHVVPERSVEARHMIRSKLELHVHYLPPMPFLPESLRPEMYTNARIAVVKTFGSQHEAERIGQIRSLSELLGYLASGPAEKDSLQIEVSATVLRVHLIPAGLLEKLPFIGSKLNDLTYLRIGELKGVYTGPAAQDLIIWVLENVYGGVLLGGEPLPRNKLTAPPGVAGAQRALINPWEVAAAISGRPGAMPPMTVADRQLAQLRGHVSSALGLFSKGTGRVAVEMHRHTASILAGAGRLDDAMTEGKIDQKRAQRIIDLARQADQAARELTGWIRAEPTRDAPTVFEAKKAAVQTLIEEISSFLQGPLPNPPPASGSGAPPSPPAPGGPPGPAPGPAPGIPGSPPATTHASPAIQPQPPMPKVAVVPATAQAVAGQGVTAPPRMRTTPLLPPAGPDPGELGRIRSLAAEIRTWANGGEAGPAMRMIMEVPGFGETLATVHPVTYQALVHSAGSAPGVVDVEVRGDGAATSLTEILDALRAMQGRPTGLVVMGSTGEMHPTSAEISARIHEEFPDVRVVVATSVLRAPQDHGMIGS